MTASLLLIFPCFQRFPREYSWLLKSPNHETIHGEMYETKNCCFLTLQQGIKTGDGCGYKESLLKTLSK